MYVFVAEIAELLLKGLSTLIKLPFQTFWIIEVLCIFFFSAFHLSQNNDTGKVATEYTHMTHVNNFYNNHQENPVCCMSAAPYSVDMNVN